MKNQLYLEVKRHLLELLFTQYRSQGDILAPNDINQKIDYIKMLLDPSLQIIKKHLFQESSNETLTEHDYSVLNRELEQHFAVDMGAGVCLSGQAQKDTTWWSNKVKIEQEETDNNYYWNRLKKYLIGQLPSAVIKTLDKDTDMIMNHIGNPSLRTFDIFGMVVGHVQSGKTGNYSSLICKAVDSGYKFIVVITGNSNSLRNQTQKRINESFIGVNNNEEIGVGCGYNDANYKRKQPISLTTCNSDFNMSDANRIAGMNFDNINGPILLVIKKDTSILTNLLDWLQRLSFSSNNNISEHSMLVIDDESDYASINTKEEKDPTTINKKIRALLGFFDKRSYVAYTATPYANIFIDHEAKEKKDVRIKKNLNVNISDDLFPNDFIYALDAPTNYFGARKIFIDSNNEYIITIDDFEEILPMSHKKDHELTNLPGSLYEAINLYLLNISIRHLRGHEKKHNSMLIHISRFSDLHSRIANLVDDYLEIIKKEVISYGRLPDAQNYSESISILYKLFMLHSAHAGFSWEQVIHQLVVVIKKVVIREEHQNSKSKIEYRNDIASNIIAIGGMSLSRGFTLEGLSVSYFIRNTIFYDTLMQMGRWFGYREGYDDLCKIYLPYDIKNHFKHITLATEELMLSFKEMAKESKTPRDFGLAVKQHPNSLLQVTAKNKRKNTESIRHKMNLNGVLKETVRFSNDLTTQSKNFHIIKSFINDISNQTTAVGKTVVFSNINKEKIESFLKNFVTYQKGTIDDLMPIKFIQEYAKTIETLWDVVIYSGKSPQEIVFNNLIIKPEIRNDFHQYDDYVEIGHRKISSGTPEYAVLNNDIRKQIEEKYFEKGEKTKCIREQLKKPILMLHILKVSGFCEELPAFGVCFPDNGLDKSQTVEYIINKVEIQRLEKDLVSFVEDSDE